MSSKTLPTISLVTPSFNAQRTLEDTIHSVANQFYPWLEYVVMDGGSTDGTLEIIQKHAENITDWISEPDNGQYDAVKKGFLRTTGEVMGWLNADDMLLPGSLATVAEIFSAFPEVQWISTLAPGLWDARGRFAGTQNTPGFSHSAFLDGLFLPGERQRGYWIQQESTFWRRSLWDKVAAKAFDGVHLAGDFALWADFYRHTELYGVEYPLAGFRLVEGQRSQDIHRYMSEARLALAAARVDSDWRAPTLPYLTYGGGRDFAAVSYRLRKALNRRFGYHGRKIAYNDKRNINGAWSIVDYKFLP